MGKNRTEACEITQNTKQNNSAYRVQGMEQTENIRNRTPGLVKKNNLKTRPVVYRNLGWSLV